MAVILTHLAGLLLAGTPEAAEKTRPAAPRRLSLRAAAAVWVALSLLGWGVIAGLVWLLWW